VKKLELKIEGLSKTWRGFKLKNINLTIENGEYFILLGPTGAGKTLLLETIMGFHKPDEGRIVLNGVDITGFSPERRGIGYVSQNCVLFPHMDVRQNIEFGLRMVGIMKEKRRKQVDAMLESTGLKSLEHRRPQALSGGEKQKVALARALAVEPSTILLDEPLSALDAEASRELKKELKRIHKSGKTLIQVTHNQVEGFSLGNKMAIMRLGEIVQTGGTKQIFAEPKNEFVARFLGYENVFKTESVEKTDHYPVFKIGDLQLKVSTNVDVAGCFVAIRPEDIAVSLSPTKANENMNLLEGTIVDCSDQGHTVALTCDAGLLFQAVIIKSAFIEANFAEGQKVWLSFRSSAVKIIR
jgi:molybdate/tungstate transport system ATP-binding protein